MTSTQRFFLRLRQRAVRWYELFLYSLLLALAFGVLFEAAGSTADDAVQCGTIHSSTGVITR